MKKFKLDRIIQADQFITAYKDYYEFYDDFAKTFNLSETQGVALYHLCKLAERYGAELAKADGIITTDEMIEIYKNDTDGEAVTL